MRDKVPTNWNNLILEITKRICLPWVARHWFYTIPVGLALYHARDFAMGFTFFIIFFFI